MFPNLAWAILHTSATARSHSTFHASLPLGRTSFATSAESSAGSPAAKLSGSGSGETGSPMTCSISVTMTLRGRPATNVTNRSPGKTVQKSALRCARLHHYQHASPNKGATQRNATHRFSTIGRVAVPSCSFALCALRFLTSPIMGWPETKSAFCS